MTHMFFETDSVNQDISRWNRSNDIIKYYTKPHIINGNYTIELIIKDNYIL